MTQWIIPYALRAEVVRVLGFPDTLSSASIQSGYPFYNSELAVYQPYAMLQRKLDYLANAPTEAVRIFGAEHPAFPTFYVVASWSLNVTTPTSIAANAVVSVNVNGTASSAITTTGSETPTTLGTKIAASMALSNLLIPSSFEGSVAAYSSVPGKAGNGITIMVSSNDPSILLNGAQMSVGATNMGSDPPGEYLFDDTLTQPIWGYLPIIRALQSDILAARQDLLASKADVVTFRSTEVPERAALCNVMRRKLADALSVPLDPDIAGNRRNRGYGRTRVV
jgi:hypothetical protein